MGRSIFLSAALGLGLIQLMLQGCGSATPSSEHTPSVAVRAAPARVPEETLVTNGLETVNYVKSDSAENTVLMVELLPEGLFVVTQPQAQRTGRLKLYNRTSVVLDWLFEIKEPLRAPPAVYRYPSGVTGRRNEVFFTQLDTVHCIDLEYGDEMWREELPFSVSTRLAADELNYFVGSDNGRIYGIRKKSSTEEWLWRTGNSIKAAPVVDRGNVICASTDGSVYKFTGAGGWTTGTSWKYDTGSRIVADPVCYSRWVLVGSTDYKLYCLEMQDKTVYWQFQAQAPIEDPPVVLSYQPNQEYVYVIAVQRLPRSEVRTLFAVKLTTGQEMWRTAGVRKVVSMGKRNLYVINDPKPGEPRSVLALDILTGEEKFRFPVGGFSFVPLNSADSGRSQKDRGRIYLVAEDGTIQVIGEKL